MQERQLHVPCQCCLHVWLALRLPDGLGCHISSGPPGSGLGSSPCRNPLSRFSPSAIAVYPSLAAGYLLISPTRQLSLPQLDHPPIHIPLHLASIPIQRLHNESISLQSYRQLEPRCACRSSDCGCFGVGR